jgi:small-conductance mechanosensitive channel
MNHHKTSLIRKIFAKILTVIFFGLAIVIVLSLLLNVVEGLLNKENVTQVFLGSINTGIIALAVFELAFIINKEYSGSIEDDDKDAISSLRETLPRFIGTVCVALSLEGLIMVIKYSQLDLAGNLYYPVAIIISTALLLSSLGLFIYLTDKRSK